MLKKSESSSNIINIIKLVKTKTCKSCNDLKNLYNNNVFNTKINKKKLISYGEFLRLNPIATKKQRVDAIKNFYDNLLK